MRSPAWRTSAARAVAHPAALLCALLFCSAWGSGSLPHAGEQSTPQAPATGAEARALDLSLEDALRLALGGNREFERARIELAIAERERDAAATLRWPRLELAASYLRKSELPSLPLGTVLSAIPGLPDAELPDVELGDRDAYDARLTLSETLFAGGRVRHAIAARAAAVEQARWELIAARNDLFYGALTAYFHLARAERAAAISQAALAQAEARARDAANFFDVGLTTRDELLSLDAHVGRMRIELLAAHNAADLARLELLRTLGLPQTRQVTLTSPVDELSRRIGEDGLARRRSAEATADVAPAELARVELRALDAGLIAAQHRIAGERAALVPALVGSASAAYGRPGLDPFSEEWSTYWTAGVALSWMAWDWGERRARLQEAELLAARIRVARADVAARLRLESEATRLALVEAGERVALSLQVVAVAQERRRIIENRFDQGLATPGDLVEVQQEATRAELAEAAAVADLQIAIAAHDRARGRLADLWPEIDPE